jgi:glycosyltransferase involved in cell wall biosynthesis
MVTIAVVVPSLDGDVTRLLASIRQQTYQPSQVEVVVGVRPNGRARNQGVAKTHSEYLVFVDDDAILGSEDIIQKLIDPLIADPSIAITGASRLIPPDSSPFQQWVAHEVPRIEHQIVDEPLETNPDPPYFYCEITTTCCAMRRDLFDQIGGFDDALIRGVDTEFFVRIGLDLASGPSEFTQSVAQTFLLRHRPCPGDQTRSQPRPRLDEMALALFFVSNGGFTPEYLHPVLVCCAAGKVRL